jgi:hypothetical protein
MKVILALVTSLFILMAVVALGGGLTFCLWLTTLHPQYGVPVWVAAWVGLAWALHHADLI